MACHQAVWIETPNRGWAFSELYEGCFAVRYLRSVIISEDATVRIS
jgi:hypothetical protein